MRSFPCVANWPESGAIQNGNHMYTDRVMPTSPFKYCFCPYDLQLSFLVFLRNAIPADVIESVFSMRTRSTLFKTETEAKTRVEPTKTLQSSGMAKNRHQFSSQSLIAFFRKKPLNLKHCKRISRRISRMPFGFTGNIHWHPPPQILGRGK